VSTALTTRGGHARNQRPREWPAAGSWWDADAVFRTGSHTLRREVIPPWLSNAIVHSRHHLVPSAWLTSSQVLPTLAR